VVRARRGRPLPRSSCGLRVSGFRSATSRPPAWRGTSSSACANAGGHGCRRRSPLRRPLARRGRARVRRARRPARTSALASGRSGHRSLALDHDGVERMLVLPAAREGHPQRLRAAVLDRELPRLLDLAVAEEHLEQHPVGRGRRLPRAPPPCRRRTRGGRCVGRSLGVSPEQVECFRAKRGPPVGALGPFPQPGVGGGLGRFTKQAVAHEIGDIVEPPSVEVGGEDEVVEARVGDALVGGEDDETALGPLEGVVGPARLRRGFRRSGGSRRRGRDPGP
jgi:hypothetical protein